MMPSGPHSHFLAEKLFGCISHNLGLRDHIQHWRDQTEYRHKHIASVDAPDDANVAATGALDQTNIGHKKFRNAKSIGHPQFGIDNAHANPLPEARDEDCIIFPRCGDFVAYRTNNRRRAASCSKSAHSTYRLIAGISRAFSRATICNSRDCNRARAI